METNSDKNAKNAKNANAIFHDHLILKILHAQIASVTSQTSNAQIVSAIAHQVKLNKFVLFNV